MSCRGISRLQKVSRKYFDNNNNNDLSTPKGLNNCNSYFGRCIVKSSWDKKELGNGCKEKTNYQITLRMLYPKSYKWLVRYYYLAIIKIYKYYGIYHSFELGIFWNLCLKPFCLLWICDGHCVVKRRKEGSPYS